MTALIVFTSFLTPTLQAKGWTSRTRLQRVCVTEAFIRHRTATLRVVELAGARASLPLHPQVAIKEGRDIHFSDSKREHILSDLSSFWLVPTYIFSHLFNFQIIYTYTLIKELCLEQVASSQT